MTPSIFAIQTPFNPSTDRTYRKETWNKTATRNSSSPLPRNFLRGELSPFFLLRKSRERKSNKPIYADYRPRIRGNAQIAAPHGERLGGMKYSGDDS